MPPEDEPLVQALRAVLLHMKYVATLNYQSDDTDVGIRCMKRWKQRIVHCLVASDFCKFYAQNQEILSSKDNRQKKEMWQKLQEIYQKARYENC
ncbi:hypothetical protein CEXT_626391 [Caerostris extrusa]|uniref:Uncharacterized protein n=1 Tax=Caerostris extrusa TaxID=172846 RepID=A0AAV4W7T1_CAEEX|nr:hypothetical protein CEXT_626391 [Caerostris extrusa]